MLVFPFTNLKLLLLVGSLTYFLTMIVFSFLIQVRKMAHETGLDFSDQIISLENKYQQVVNVITIPRILIPISVENRSFPHKLSSMNLVTFLVAGFRL